MIVRGWPGRHLTYCLNVHAGERWDENRAAIERFVPEIRRRLGRRGPMGLWMSLSDAASRVLLCEPAMAAFQRLLDRHELYVFTINGFPYGTFHGRPVKEAVYAPDWRTAERLEYTGRLIDILGRLLPEGVEGSISTVPGSYGAWIEGKDDREAMARRLAQAAERCFRLREKTGAVVRLALEPEPDCFLQRTADVIAFFESEMDAQSGRVVGSGRGAPGGCRAEALREHLGICVDTCHTALQFEDPTETLERLHAAGIVVPKIQLSAALRLTRGASPQALASFADPVYLHQVRCREAGGRVRSFDDLPAALDAAAGGELSDAEWRVHCHVPLYFKGAPPIESTADALSGAFFEAVRNVGTRHLEIETYTFDVLPGFAKAGDVTESIAREYEWTLGKMLKP